MKQFLILVWVGVLLIGCQASDVARRNAVKCFDTSGLSPEERELADSLLALGLDNEALYTLFAPLKPISTVVQFSLNVARPDSLPAGIRNATSPDKPSSLRRLERKIALGSLLSAIFFRFLSILQKRGDLSMLCPKDMFPWRWIP
jgi:hypothetical protein